MHIKTLGVDTHSIKTLLQLKMLIFQHVTQYNYPFICSSVSNVVSYAKQIDNWFIVNGGIARIFLVLALFLVSLIHLLERIRLVKRASSTSNLSSSGLQTLKSPISIPFCGPLVQLLWNKKEPFKPVGEWMTAFGGICKMTVGNQEYVWISEPSFLKKLLSSNAPGHLNRASFLLHKLFVGPLQDGLEGAADVVGVWKPHRTVLNRGFTYEALKTYIGIMDKYASELACEIGRQHCHGHSDGLETTNVKEMIHMCTIKMMTHIATGYEEAVLNHDDDRNRIYQFHKNVERIATIAMYRMENPWMMSDFLFSFHPFCKERDGVVMPGLKNFIQQIIDEFRKQHKISKEDLNIENTDKLENKHGQAIIKSDNRCKDEKGDSGGDNAFVGGEGEFKSLMELMIRAGLSDKEIVSEVMTTVMAGHESVGVSFTFLLFYLALNQDHQTRCCEEVDRAFELLKTSSRGAQGHTSFSIDILHNLHHLDRCIKETLRIRPIFSLFTRHLEEPLQLREDLVLNPGVTILVSPWVVHHSPEYYTIPEKFDPDRFLPENAANRSVYSYIPFSLGSRNCIGWKLALLQLKILAVHILRNYEVYTTDKEDDVKVKFNFTTTTEKDINFVFKKRTHMQN